MIHYYIGPSGLIFDIRMHFAAGRCPISRRDVTPFRGGTLPHFAVRRCPTAQIHADFQPANIKAHHKDSIIRMAESPTYLSPGDIATAEGRMYLTPGHRPGKIHADFQPANINAHPKDSIIRMAESPTYLSPGDIATAEGRTHISPWAMPVG